jgi:hypothetical protein
LQRISADAIDPGMDQGRFMFVLNIPLRFEAFAIVWPEFILVAGLGLVCFLASLGLFRRSMTRST